MINEISRKNPILNSIVYALYYAIHAGLTPKINPFIQKLLKFTNLEADFLANLSGVMFQYSIYSQQLAPRRHNHPAAAESFLYYLAYSALSHTLGTSRIDSIIESILTDDYTYPIIRLDHPVSTPMPDFSTIHRHFDAVLKIRPRVCKIAHFVDITQWEDKLEEAHLGRIYPFSPPDSPMHDD